MKKANVKKSVYGGQALIEGLMIKGPSKTCIAVRKNDNEIVVKQLAFSSSTSVKKIPLLRGIVEFFKMNVEGIKALSYSAELIEVEESEPSEFEKRLQKIFGEKLEKVFLYLAVTFSIFFSVGLFILLPNVVVSLAGTHNALLNNSIEGILKLTVFAVYLMLTSKLEDMKRVWMYHGAEHKTIHCFEHQEPLTVENIKKYSTKHPRCGTSFIFMVLIISIVLYTFVGWHNVAVNILLRLLLVPLIAGISYELFRLLWKSDSAFVRVISLPGMAFQYFTTKEPDDGQIEVAITAFNAALEQEENEIG